MFRPFRACSVSSIYERLHMSERESSLFAAARPDPVTMDAMGNSVLPQIDGVLINTPPVHSDHRGALVEMYTRDDFWVESFAYAYQTSIRPGMLKGWFAHDEKVDRYHLASGELLVLLYDDRPESPTKGLVQRTVLSEATDRQVLIPRRVWHLSLNIGSTDAILINLPSSHYDPSKPDRRHVDIESGKIPVDVRSFFPVVYKGPNEIQPTLH